MILRLCEIGGVLMRLDHVASIVCTGRQAFRNRLRNASTLCQSDLALSLNAKEQPTLLIFVRVRCIVCLRGLLSGARQDALSGLLFELTACGDVIVVSSDYATNLVQGCVGCWRAGN
jgi:hypothetical protein